MHEYSGTLQGNATDKLRFTSMLVKEMFHLTNNQSLFIIKYILFSKCKPIFDVFS